MRQHKKHLDFEVNLIPFIDLLSVCICFLLLTAVWLNIGTINVKQAVGGQPVAETVKKPLVWVFLSEKGDITLDVRDSGKIPAKFKKITVGGSEGKLNLDEVDKAITQLKTLEPDLNTALIQPKGQTAYEEIIGLMDQFKKKGLFDLGVVPL